MSLSFRVPAGWPSLYGLRLRNCDPAQRVVELGRRRETAVGCEAFSEDFIALLRYGRQRRKTARFATQEFIRNDAELDDVSLRFQVRNDRLLLGGAARMLPDL